MKKISNTQTMNNTNQIRFTKHVYYLIKFAIRSVENAMVSNDKTQSSQWSSFKIKGKRKRVRLCF